MNQYSLLIGENLQEVDIDEKIGIAFSKQYEDLDDPTKIYATWSKTVELPMTTRNNQIFDNLFRPDQVITNTGIDPRKKLPFVLLHNQEFIVTGYAKVLKVDSSQKSKKYCITLYSVLGEIMNDLKQLTFNAEKANDPKYVISNPLSDDCVINRHLVKQCWEQTGHTVPLANKGNLDYVGFMPTYQGEYDDFDSAKIEVLPGKFTNYWGEDFDDSVDEHYLGDYRSYYQQPYVWVDAIIQLLKQKIESITDYKINLDPSWFNAQNPYWTKAIISCPTLFNNEEVTGHNPKEKYEYNWNQYVSNTSQQNDLSSHHKQILKFTHQGGDRIIDTHGSERFRAPQGGTAHFKESIVWTLFAVKTDPQLTDGYCRLRNANNLFLSFRAVDAQTMQNIPGAVKTFMFYSGSNEYTSGYDEAIELGVASRNHPTYVTSPDPSVVRPDCGYAWAGQLNVEFDITWNRPYYIICDQYARNNGDPFETALGSWIPRWDWLWTDLFQDYDNPGISGIRGLYWYVTNYDSYVEETDGAIRSNSKLTMDRVWSFDENPFELILKYCKMFRLVFDYDKDSKELTIMTRDRFFSHYTIEDWTNKLDKSKDYNVEPINFDKKYFNFKYKEGSGQRMEYYQDKYLTNYGSYKLDTGYDFNSDSNDIFDDLQPSMICTKKQDSSMFNTRYPDKPNYLGWNYKYLPKEYFVENDNDGKNAGNAGAFYFRDGRYRCDERIHNKNTNNVAVIRISDDSERQIKDRSYCWHLLGEYMVQTEWLPAVTPYIDGYAFQFSKPAELYYNRDILNPSSVKYIYERWWKKYLDERYSVQTKVLTAYFYLQANDFLNFKFNKFVMVDNILYMVNKIYDFNLTTDKTTKVQLVQVNDIEAYTNTGLSFSYLYTAANNFTVNTSTVSEVEVFSSSEWTIKSCSSWLWAAKSGNTLQIRAYNISFPTDSKTSVVLQNNDGLEYNVNLTVEVTGTYLTTAPNSLSFTHNSGSKEVAVNSNPRNVTIVSKPSWITANLTIFGIVDDNNPNARMRMFTLNVSAANNPYNFSRNGNIILTNGYDTVSVAVTQQAQPNIEPIGPGIEDPDNPHIRRIELVAGEAVPLTLYTYKQINLNATKITNGLVSVTGSNKIDQVTFLAQPEISEQHRIEDKTVDGGIITMETVDGELIKWNYNLGGSLQRYNVLIESLDWEQGTVTVDGVTETYIGSDPVNTQHTISATAETGYTFVQWSDGNSNASRTITITDNTVLYAIFVESGALTTYTVTNTLTNCRTNNNTASVVEGTAYTATLTPFTWYTLDNVTVTMGGVNVTTQYYSNGVINIPSVTGNIVITASAGWGEWDYVWSAEEGVAPKDFENYNADPTTDIGTLPELDGTMDTRYFIFKEGKFYVPQSKNLVYEMQCGFVANAQVDKYPDIRIVNADGIGFLSYFDQNSNTMFTDLGFAPGDYQDMGQKIIYGREPQLMVIKMDGNTGSFTYGNNVSFNGALNAENNTDSFIIAREDSVGCNMYVYAIRAKFKQAAVPTHSVSISSNGGGSVKVNGVSGNYSATVAEGTQLSLNVTPNTGYQFVKWSDNNYNAMRTITVLDNVTLTATFETIVPANNEIRYVTTDNQILTLSTPVFEDANSNALTVTSHTYTNGRGTILLSGDLYYTGTAFQGKTTLQQITFPASLRKLDGTFRLCNNLTTVNGIGNLTEIGNLTFQWCHSLTRFDIPSSVTRVGDSVFNGCINLTKVRWSQNITYNGKGVFSGCAALTTVTMNGGDMEIGDNMFYNCQNLLQLTVPASATKIGDRAFYQCYGIYNLDLSASTITTVSEYAIYKTKLTSLKFPDPLTTVKSYGIANNPELDNLAFGKYLTLLDDRALTDNPVLKTIYCWATTAPTLGVDVFNGIPTGGVLHIPNGSDYSSWRSELPADWTIIDDL